MSLDIRITHLDTLNSMTRYPSIPTYHALDSNNGNLLKEHMTFSDQVIGTEKIDGVNARIIFLPDSSYVIGNKRELLYIKGDPIGNPTLSIVSALQPIAASLTHAEDGSIRIYYFEVYGGTITATSEQYTAHRLIGFRLIDILIFRNYSAVLAMSPAQNSTVENQERPYYLGEYDLNQAAADAGLLLAPRLFTIDAANLPTDISKTMDFLKTWLPHTRSSLDDGARGKAEGIVLRTADRSTIAQARFADYEHTCHRT